VDFRPVDETERGKQLKALGLKEAKALFTELLPPTIQLVESLDLPDAQPERTVDHLLKHLAASNEAAGLLCFAGGGAYDHYVPAAVEELVHRSEFYTSYTQYQAEVSQGFLQALFEYQTLLCRLTGMEIANSSLYDGASALAEAVIMALRLTGRQKILVPAALNPLYRKVLQTYLGGLGVELVDLPADSSGQLDLGVLKARAADDIAAVVVQTPNWWGVLEELAPISEAAHKVGALLIVVVNPISLALLKPPGEYDADIVVGEGQPLGLPLGFGGPYLGLFACKYKFLRQVPGRLVGKTQDAKGRTAYCLTLQTREQHIRRDKATSNICSNQALCALQAGAYLTLLGKAGLEEVALASLVNAHKLQEALLALDGVERVFSGPFFNEFTLSLPLEATTFLKEMYEEGIIAGLAPGQFDDYPNNWLLVAVTEKRTEAELAHYVESASKVIANAR